MSEFLKHFEMFEKYLQDIYDQSAEGKPDKNVYRNQIFIMDCIKNGLVANPNLIFCIAEPSLARTYPPSNLQFFSENLAKDSNQAEAVKKIVGTKNMMVIQGPPGAGKTTVIVEAIRQIKKLHPKSKVLLTSTTHVAVDNVIKKLMDTNLSLARLRNKDDVKKDQSKQALLKLDIDYILEDLIKNNKLVKGYKNDIATHFPNELIVDKDVVGITVNCLKGCRLAGYNIFEYGIVDEVGKTTLPELLFVAKYCKRLVLIGDPKQLPASLGTLESYNAITKEEYDEINLNPYINYIFDNAYHGAKMFLKNQYRMVQEIGCYISDAFYDDNDRKLQNGRKDSNPNALNFVDYDISKGPRVTSENLQNEYEVEIIKKLIDTKLSWCQPKDIAIIAPYKDQVTLLRNSLKGYTINTVDAFQGEAAKVVIFSCVRNAGKPTSFFEKENRVNVAVSRAQDAVWVIGSRKYVEQIPHFNLYTNFNKQFDGLHMVCHHHYYNGTDIVPTKRLEPKKNQMNANRRNYYKRKNKKTSSRRSYLSVIND